MQRRRFLSLFGAGALAAALPVMRCGSRRRPNFIVILVDDLGWTDLGCTGSDLHRTPNIDRLAGGGVRFTHAYSACTVCSPTRAAMMTGKYPARLHITDWITGHKYPWARLLPPEWTKHLPLEQVTAAEVLRDAGYATAHIGKWHLGDAPYWPEHQGFDLNIAGYNAGQPPSYFYPYQREGSWNSHIPTLEGGEEGEYLTDREAMEACRFIEDNRDRPFFLYLAHYAVHTPLQAKADKIEACRTRLRPGLRHDNPVYAAMVESVDESLGTIETKLSELGLLENTVILFTGDNGGLILRDVTDNSPLRSGKGSPYEGGVRVPLICRAPGTGGAGTECAEPVMTIDVLPTLAAMAGVTLPGEADGLDLSPLLRDPGSSLGREALFWHYPHYHPGGSTPYGAVRKGAWKLIELYEDGRLELYNLLDDVGESRNRVSEEPELAQQMHGLLVQWREAVDAQMPRPNPDYDPDRAGQSRGAW